MIRSFAPSTIQVKGTAAPYRYGVPGRRNTEALGKQSDAGREGILDIATEVASALDAAHALKLPFSFPLYYQGNGFDFSARPFGDCARSAGRAGEGGNEGDRL